MAPRRRLRTPIVRLPIRVGLRSVAGDPYLKVGSAGASRKWLRRRARAVRGHRPGETVTITAVRLVRSVVVRRAASFAACLVLAVMTVQIAPPVAAASSSASSTSAKQDPAKAKTQPKGPSDTSLAQTQAPTEVPSLSTAYSNSYDNHDGTYTASVSATPINYRPTTGGAWAPIDLTLSAISGGNGRLRAAKTGAPVEVGSPDDAAGFVSLDTTAGKISLSLAPGAKPGRSGSKPVSGTNRADVAGLLPGVDLRVVPSSDGFRVFLVLASNPAKPSFTFTLNSPGMTPALQADGSISFTDKTGNLIASMPQPYATDSTVDQSGGGRYTNKVSYALATTGGRNLLTVNVDPSWLASAVYPVYVDPTVATVSGTTNAKDTFVDYAWPASNFKDAVNGSVHEFVIGYDGNTPNPDLPNNKEVCYGLLSFAMPTDAIGSTIDSASLAVYTYYGWVTTAKTVYFDRITSTWSSTSVTWNSKPSYTNLGSAELAPGDTSAFDVKSTVQSWADGAANYGFQLRASDTNDTYWKRLDSSEQNGVHIPSSPSPTAGERHAVEPYQQCLGRRTQRKPQLVVQQQRRQREPVNLRSPDRDRLRLHERGQGLWRGRRPWRQRQQLRHTSWCADRWHELLLSRSGV
jgi:hypothetical protein